ncbi:MAG: alpha/beta hydrolase [Chthoniobacteraceae bacterium]|jgi:acetyl esterase/lipase
MSHFRSSIIRILLLFAIVPPGGAFAAPNRVLLNIPYVPNGSPGQRLDLYLPAQPGPPSPLVVWIHGGAWRAGSKDVCPARILVPFGYAAASIEYRFSQEAVFPAQIEDCKAAIRWLRAHAAEYNIDPARIGVWGASAGGHLVAMLGVTGNIRDFDVGANLNESSAVQCVVDYFGPVDFLHYGPPGKVNLDGLDSAVDELLGGPVAADQARARRASPVYYVTGHEPPFLILQGDRDPLVPYQQSQELEAVLLKAGDQATLKMIPGAGHGGPGFNTPQIWSLVGVFTNRWLRPERPHASP